MTEKVPGRVVLNNVRIAGFMALNEPKDYKSDGKFKYSVKLLFKEGSENHKAVVKALKEVAAVEWKDEAPAIYKALQAGNLLALRDGDAKIGWAGFPGNLYVSASARDGADDPPRLLSRDKKLLSRDTDLFYPGCYVDAILDAWAQNNSWGQRINATIRAVRFREDGERLSLSAIPVDDDMFEALPGTDVFEEEDLTDDSPF